MAEQEDEYFRFLLVGKTGSGKSTTGNTIFGEDLFSSSVSFRSVTTECDLQRSKQPGRVIEIMDCPGLFDTNKTEDELHNAIVKAVIGTHPGPHAVLYVIKIGRYTTEDFEVYSRLKHVFDANISNYMIVIFTHGDLLEKTNKELKDLLSHAPKQLHQVVSECSGRCVVFNNAAKEKQRYVGQLLQEVRALKTQNGDQPYVCSKYANIAEGVKAEVYFRVLNANKQVVETGIEAGDDVLAEMEREEAMTDEQKTEAYQVELDRLRDEITRDNDPSYVAWAVQNLYTAVSASYHFAGSSVRSRGPGYRARLRHLYQRYTGKRQGQLHGTDVHSPQTAFQNLSSTVAMAAKKGMTFRFLMVGKSGCGKSSTGNTILGEDMFPTGTGLAAVTKICEHRVTTKKNTRIEVVDSPGLFDPERPNEDVRQEIVKTATVLHPGPHAVLYVLKLDRYTPEEYSTYQKLKEVFDADIVKYIIIVFTGGDRLKNETLDDILENAGPTFRKVAEECGNRVIIFNNLDKKKNKETQVKKLLEMTQKVVRENGENPYRCTVQEKVGDKLEETVTNSVKSLVEKAPKLKEFFSQIEAMLRQSQNRADSHKAKLDETIKRKKEVEATEQKMREEMEREKREREEEERKEKERKEAEEQEKKRQEEEAREKARKEEEEEKERKEEEERKEKERKKEEARREKGRKEEEARRERQRKEEEKQRREEELRHQKELLELERKKKQLELEAKKEEEKFRKEMREKEELERKRREEMDDVHRLEMERKKKEVVENKDTHWTQEAAGALWKGAKGWLGF